MKALTKIALVLAIICMLTACTDRKKNSDEDATECDTQNPVADKSDETQDWGLGIVMPQGS